MSIPQVSLGPTEPLNNLQAPPPPTLPQSLEEEVPSFIDTLPNMQTSLAPFEVLFASLGCEDFAQQKSVSDLAEREDYIKKLNNQFSHIASLEPMFGKKSVQGFFEPYLMKTIEMNPLICWMKQIAPKTAPVNKDLSKAHFFADIIELLSLELEFYQLLQDYTVASKKNKMYQDIIFETQPVKFVGKLFFIPIPRWDISTTEGFACYLRFTKTIKAFKAEVFTPEEKILIRKMNKKDKNAKAQCTFFAVKWRQSEESEKCDILSKKINQVLARANALLALNNLKTICKSLAPAFGSLLVLYLDEIRNTCGRGTYDPKNDPEFVHYLPLQECFLENICESYLDHQTALFKKAFDNLQEFIKTHPDFGKECENYPTPEKFTESVHLFKKHFHKVNNTDSATLSEQLLQELLNDVPLEKAGENLKAVLTKRKKKRNAKSLPPPSAEIEPQQQIDTPQICPQAASLSIALFQASQNQRPHYWHERVKRWFASDPAGVRNFVDYRQGEQVYQYQDLSPSQLNDQMLYHGFSPFVDKIFSDPLLKDKYTLETKRGAALFVELLTVGQKSKKGVIFFGIQNRCCFHRKIEIKKDEEFQNLTLEQLSEPKFLDREDSDTDQQNLVEELSSGFVGDEILVDDLEIIKCIDKKNLCQINIFPLK